MTNNTASASGSSKSLQVGDHVRFLFRERMMEAVVTEDRGPIGWKGRRLLRVEVIDAGARGSVLEMPEEELVPA
jgi:hypothetical protein